MRVNFVLTGKSPLLMHADDVERADLLKEWQKDPDNKNISVAGDDRSPAWTWLNYVYHDGENICWPAANLMAVLRQAAAQFKLKGNKTFKEASQSAMCPADGAEFFEFRCAGRQVPFALVNALADEPFAAQKANAVKLGFTLDVRRARVGQAKHVRVRPRFDAWEVRGALEVFDAEILTPDLLASMFEVAGRGGLGDWRPACKTPGSYGRFEAAVKVTK